MANGIPVWRKDINGKPIYTGQTVIMRYRDIEVEGIVRVRGYKYRNRLFCIETCDKVRYPFELHEEIEIIKDLDYESK